LSLGTLPTGSSSVDLAGLLSSLLGTGQ
jgi:hypothetical protein